MGFCWEGVGRKKFRKKLIKWERLILYKIYHKSLFWGRCDNFVSGDGGDSADKIAIFGWDTDYSFAGWAVKLEEAGN